MNYRRNRAFWPARVIFPTSPMFDSVEVIRVPAPWNLRDVPKIFDGGDIDYEGRWYGDRMCCLECRATEAMRMSPTSTYMLVSLDCGECGRSFGEFWQ